MGGGLIQLMAIGPQNNKICGNPKVSFFKCVYSQYCNFGIEWFYQYFQGEKKLGKTIKCILDKKGDLLREMYIVFEISSNSYEIPKLGLRLIDYVEIQIGGQTIDKHYGEWLDIWTQLNYTHGKYEVFKSLIKDKYSSSTQSSTTTTNNCGSTSIKRLYVPLIFWFNLNPGLALPLVSLQYHEVTLYLKIKALEDLQIYTTKTPTSKAPLAANSNNKLFEPATGGGNVWGGGITTTSTNDVVGENTIAFIDMSGGSSGPQPSKWHTTIFNGEIHDVYLMCEYIFLDVKQKKRFALAETEYLITQVQYTDKLDLNPLTVAGPTATASISLQFNHPIKQLIFAVYPSSLNNFMIYKNMDNSFTVDNIELYANNSKITEINNVEFYTLLKPFAHYNCGGFTSSDKVTNFNGGFYLYSFGINPASFQPSGSLNFSRLNDFSINFTYVKTDAQYTTIAEPYKFMAFGHNYNILKIKNGMGGILYSS
uniref:Major capsid protein N-terminal domain-containing protein n=1 Tax=viral metagenome TaxID=1070528 RepID=A0A6C0B619_9ZZZZ